MVLTIVTDSIFTVLANVSNKDKKTSAPMNKQVSFGRVTFVEVPKYYNFSL